MSNQGCIPIVIVVNDYVNNYTSQPNAINTLTYPVTGVALNITYNGSTIPPLSTGDYNLFIEVADSRYCYSSITGTYSIVGDLAWQQYLCAWGGGTGRGTSNIPYIEGGDGIINSSGLIGIQKVVGGSGFGVALMSDNSLVSWGNDNTYGQQNFPYLNNYIKDIAASNNTTFIIDWSGNLTGCGYLFNTLGNGYSGGIIPYFTGISQVSATDTYAIAVKSNMASGLVGWGRSSYFNFAQNLSSSTNVQQVCTTQYAVTTLSNGTANAWGVNYFGQIGWFGGNTNVKKISCSDLATAFLYKDKTISIYGKQINQNGNIFDFTIPDPSVQGHVLDINIFNTHCLLILDKPIKPIQVVQQVNCTGIVYAQ